MHDRPALGVMEKRGQVEILKEDKRKKKEIGFFHQERGYLKFSQTSWNALRLSFSYQKDQSNHIDMFT
jgi:hypothetical protein